MEYFFIPGRLKDLSWVELESVCKTVLGSAFSLKEKNDYFLLKTDVSLNFVEDVFKRLGGFLKYGTILENDVDIVSLLDGEKIVFGISSYTSKYSFRDLKSLSQGFKETFTGMGKKVRFVLPKEEDFLSASQVLNNHLISEGFELVLLEDASGKTLGVQDIEGFSARDYSKPFVDKQMGVLPIKLARMMINFANIKQGKSLWDPFCGSGNILLEGLDLGYSVLGSDIDQESLDGSKANISWVKKRFDYKANSQVFFLDILNPTRSKLDIVKNSDLGGIICEPYMGKPQRKLLDNQQANSLVKQHYSLVQSLFFAIDQLGLKEKIRVVVIFPEYKTYKGWVSIERDLLDFKNTKLIKFPEKDLHWSRRNSIIKRLIFVFEYIPK